MDSCSHTFVYHSVIPPGRCPRCGQCLHPAHAQPYRPMYPTMPAWPYAYPSDWTGYPIVTNTNTTAF